MFYFFNLPSSGKLIHYMHVKIDTKEKFTVITADEVYISANMTEELGKLLHSYLEKTIPHLIFNVQSILNMDDEAALKLAEIQQNFQDNNASFVICSMQPGVEAQFDRLNLRRILNHTPTESEAWDIVQMEEIERELLRDWDDDPA